MPRAAVKRSLRTHKPVGVERRIRERYIKAPVDFKVEVNEKHRVRRVRVRKDPLDK